MTKDFKYWDNEPAVSPPPFSGSWHWDEVGIYLYEEESCEYESVSSESSTAGCSDIGSFLSTLALICFPLPFETICSTSQFTCLFWLFTLHLSTVQDSLCRLLIVM